MSSVEVSNGDSALLHASAEDSQEPWLKGRMESQQAVKLLEERWPEGLAKVEQEEWEEVLFTVDSGAMDIVVGTEECPQFQLSESPGSKKWTHVRGRER